MEAQVAQFLNRGMNQDISVSKANNEFAFENHNIRITAVNDNTLLSVTNEKGPKQLDIYIENQEDTTNILGIYKGHTILNKYLVVFTSDTSRSTDYIYRLVYENDTIRGVLLYSGNLNIWASDILDILPYYESEEVQKVYWADGINQLRFINIVSSEIKEADNTQFDINPVVDGNLSVEILKSYEGLGTFPSGIIQYFITYYNKFGAESNVVWGSPIYYINYRDRAASPEETVNCNFILNLSNVDASYDYVRVYSIKRSAINGTPDARLVADVFINNRSNITIEDLNSNQETIDSYKLLFVGGNEIIPTTLTQKDDTLFLGNVTVNDVLPPTEIEESLREYDTETGIYNAKYITFETKEIPINKYDSYYNYENESSGSSLTFKTFKKGEIYRFALQFQTKTGVWTSPVWIGDKECNVVPSTDIDNNKLLVANAVFNMPDSLKTTLENDYINYRLLMAETDISTRNIIAQGVVSPTVFNYKDRCEDKAYAASSWIMRPRGGNTAFKHLDNTGVMYSEKEDGTLEAGDENVEIQGLINREAPTLTTQISNKEYITLGLQRGHVIVASIGNITYDSDNNPIINEFERFSVNRGSWKKAYNAIVDKLEERGITIENLEYTDFDNFITGGPDEYGYVIGTDNTWQNINTGGVPCHEWLVSSNRLGLEGGYVMSSFKDVSEAYNEAADIKKKQNNFYIDSSIVTFHSPDLESVKNTLSDFNFRIVGIVPITGSYSDIEATIEPGYFKGASLNKENIKNTININEGANTLVSGFLYEDYGLTEDNLNPGNYSISENKIRNYNVYMWNKQGNIVATGNNVEGVEDYSETASKLIKKVIGNLRFSAFTDYQYDNIWWESETKGVQLFDSENLDIKKLDLGFKSVFYSGNYDKLLSFTEDNAYYNITENEIYEGLNVYDPVRIKYKTTPHAVFSFVENTGIEELRILPYLSGNEEEPEFISNLYENIGSGEYPWGVSIYSQEAIHNVTCNYPYLYIGELYRNIPYESLYGGIEDTAIQQIKWLPISSNTPIDQNITLSEGDTYYQRWDCLKTYPYTEEDINSVVDITSFMVETHTNLESRYDKNRGIQNLINCRPTNFNLFNDVYSQKNNLFTYNILDPKFNNSTYTNQVLFSLSKTPNSNIDIWADINMVNALNLDGAYGNIIKLSNLNDVIVAFQEKAISTINFNNTTALSTESGVPIEIANSGKVNGYSIITSTTGCQNKNSICTTPSGIYFIDDLNKALFRINKEGISNISSNGMSMWFKNNLTANESIFYDNLNNDLYITNNTDCLVYNDALQSFTSFMDYQGINALFNFNGETFALNTENYNTAVYKMFAGLYNSTFNTNIHKGFYIQYKINPEPLLDKVFTNIEYIAEGTVPIYKVDEVYNAGSVNPFTKLNVWTNFQEGETIIKDRHTYPNFERKFNLWRVDVPRSSNRRDRIRSPWMYLKLSSDSTLNIKSVFHSLLVYYYR